MPITRLSLVPHTCSYNNFVNIPGTELLGPFIGVQVWLALKGCTKGMHVNPASGMAH